MVISELFLAKRLGIDLQILQKIDPKLNCCPLNGRIQIWRDFLKNDH